jgi:agmatine deiminase
MPGEFEPHAGRWMLWPERPDNWRLGAKPAEQAFVAVAKAIAHSERLTMGVSNAQFRHARTLLPPHIRVVELSHDDAWMRDCGPTFVVNDKGGVRAIDWEFNAWGGLDSGLYFPWDRDDDVPPHVADIEWLDRYLAPLILEGGSIHVDGQGTLMATEECLLNPNRNPKLSQSEIEAVLRDYLSIDQFIWLGLGVYNDETSGHVDNLACFVKPGVVVLNWTDDPADPNYEISRDAYSRLSHATDARGRSLEIHKLHQPEPVIITAEEASGVDQVAGTLPRKAGDRMAASYVNFYITNGSIILPSFDDAQDGPAQDILAGLFPSRAITPIPAREILLGGGNIHCITQQQPAGQEKS